LQRLPAAVSAQYRRIQPATIDQLAKTDADLTTGVVNQRLTPLAGQKRPRRQQQHSHAIYSESSSNSDGYHTDDANISSDAAQGSSYQRPSGRRPKKRRALSRPPNDSRHSKPSAKGKKEPRRKLVTTVDWDDRWWETQKMPPDLKESIEACENTKSTRSDADPCPVLTLLSGFGVRWDHVLRCMYCVNHSRLIPGDDFRYHFGGRLHPMAIRDTTRYTFLTASAFHLAECYPNIRNQDHEKLKQSLPAMLQEPIEVKDPHSLKLRYKCPVMDCAYWVAVNEGRGALETELRRHVKTHNKVLGVDIPSVSPQWTQKVGVGKGAGGNGYNEVGSNHYFMLPDTFSTSTKGTDKPDFLTTNLAAPSTDTWATSLGWEEYIDGITEAFGSRQKAVEKLRDLVALPSPHRVLTAVGSLKILEHGLLVSTKLNLSYLEDAATWVSLTHGPFRAHFAHGRYVQHFSLLQ
jgi:hypothetical protein